eukprot:NODE_969_length_1068_cov_91.165849_g798_i0.p5 GENE.NODE_969_length_1068_cov_91.165849_g798_i0~~NODE_969_length_1068_cov_91.165849_g798_i0.p5  ORF type:complete len:57 (+),score=3.35 NODE_969_length_1068_cov_91.165849_g798_i0:549-719(+)
MGLLEVLEVVVTKEPASERLHALRLAPKECLRGRGELLCWPSSAIFSISLSKSNRS